MENLCEQLDRAIADGDITAVQTLIGQNPKLLLDFAFMHKNELSPLHIAINKDQTAIAKVLLKCPKQYVSKVIHHQDFRGETPLHRCGWCGNQEVARKLISAGAEVNAKNNLGLSPLHLAAERGHLEIVKLLIKKGANVNASSNRGNTPLHRAAKEGHLDVISLLTKKGADPNKRNNSGFKALPTQADSQVPQKRHRSSSIRKSIPVAIMPEKRGSQKSNQAMPSHDNQSSQSSEKKYQVDQARLPGIDVEYYEISPDQIITNKKLGEGGFGAVYEGSCAGQPVALKKLTSTKVTVHSSFRSELSMLCKLRHPNIVLLLGAVIQPDQLCLVMELCQGGPLNRLLKQRRLSSKEVILIARQIAMAMNWLHTRQPPILHLDLKPGNILLTDSTSMQIKVSDFGLARSTQSKSGAVVGTRRYMAPEMMKRQSVTEKADVYSFGVLLWQIYTRKRPFGQFSGLKTSQEKKEFCDYVWDGNRPLIPYSMPPPLAALINRCWATEPNRRPGFQDVADSLEHILLSCLISDPGGHNFWRMFAPSSSYDTVGMEWKVLKQCLGAGMKKDQPEPDWVMLKKLFCDSPTSEFVPMQRFANVANMFAPFDPPYAMLMRAAHAMTATFPNKKSSTDSMAVDNAEQRTNGMEDVSTGNSENTEKSGEIFFLPFTPLPRIFSFLYGKPPGSFILSSCPQVDAFRPFTLSLVGKDSKEVLHKRIHFDVKKRIYFLDDFSSKPNMEYIADFILSDQVRGHFGLLTSYAVECETEMCTDSE